MCPLFAYGSAIEESSSVGQASGESSLPELSEQEGGSADEEQVTIIVELEDGGVQGISLFSLFSEDVSQDRHCYFKDAIRAIAAGQSADEAQDSANGSSGISLFSLFEEDEAEYTDSTSNATVEEVYDYYNAFDGFAVKAPAGTLSEIQQLDGVANAFIEQTYDVPVDMSDADDADSESTVENQNALDATGADEVAQTGEGQLIAIIDTGLDTDHEAFSGDIPDETLALTQSQVEGMKGSLHGSGGTWISEKIPFVYDYADSDADVNPGLSGLEHGTHVSGIAAANGGEIRGTAPDAQLIMMKIASDSNGGMADSTILAALDDCAVILPDAVNMSLGSNVGFGDAGDSTYSTVIKNLEEFGVTVNVAAGNSYSSAQNNQSGQNLPYATDPDTSMMSSPAASSGSLAVASVGADPTEIADEPDADAGTYLTASDGTQIQYWETLDPDGAARVNKFADVADGTYQVVWADSGTRDGILGEVSGSLEGKIALVKGHYDFWGSTQYYSRAVANLSSKGAVAVIIYDPDASQEEIEAGMCLGGASDGGDTGRDWYDADSCPCIFVGADDGAALQATAAASRTVTKAAASAGTEVTYSSYYQMNSWSSWGVTPDLKLKPEIAAPGGNIYSSMPNGEYSYMSGTSMATPQMTGISAQMHEYVDEDSKFTNMSASEKTAVVTQLLMSTATPLADTNDLSSYYSPRHQGAGLADVVAATTSDVYATVEGADNESRPKADLGESENGTYSFTVTLHNLGSAVHTYRFDAAALSEKVTDGLFLQQSENWTGKGISVTATVGGAQAESVTVSAGSTASVTVSIQAESAFTSWAAENTPNGTFIDGFAMFKVAEGDAGAVDLSVPFMGFYGDWSDASALDAAAGDDAQAYHLYGTKLVDAETGDYLGVNPLDYDNEENEEAIDLDKIVLSNSTYANAPTKLATKTGLLRSVDKLTYAFGDDSVSYNYVTKTYYYSSYSTWMYAEQGSVFGGASPVMYFEEGDSDEMTLTITATTSGSTPEDQSQGFTVHYDTTSPTITKSVYNEGDEPSITFTVEDDTYLAAIDFVNPEMTGVTPYSGFHRVLVDPDTALTETKADGTKVYKVTVPVADIKAAWNEDGEIPNTVSAYAWDYGMNPSLGARAVVNPIAATGIAISNAPASLAPGESVQLSANLFPTDTTQIELVWTVDDETIATIDEDGVLTGVADGTVTVSVAVADNPEVKNSTTVYVADVAATEGIRLSNDVVRVESKGGTVQVQALLADDLADATVTWTTSDAETATVAAGDDGDASDIQTMATDPASASATATITGDYYVRDATITASVTDANGKTYTDTMTVQNRPADYDDFVIEDGVLVKYLGVKSAIEIPNDVTALADRVFEGNVPIEEVTIPASVQTIGERAFAKLTYTTESSWVSTGSAKAITFEDTDEHPSQLTYIGERAFADGGTSGTFIMPDSVTSMGEGVFESCLSLSAVRLSDNLTEIPASTFKQCVGLSHLAMSDKVTKVGAEMLRSAFALYQIEIIGKDSVDGIVSLPSALVEIGDSAFSNGYLGAWIDEDGNTRGSKVVLPSGVKRLESSAFSLDTYIVEAELNDGLESIGQSVFSQTNVYELVLPDTVTELDWHAFSGMTNLREITLSRNLGDGELEAAFGSYDNSFNGGSTHMQVESVVVPEGTLHYSKVGDAVLNADGTRFVYYPAALTGDYAMPEGVTSIAEGAFDDSQLSSLTLPSTLETVEETGIAKQFDTLDFGENVISIAANAFKRQFYADDSANAGYTPAHLIVRGGQSGSYADTQNASSQKTAFFGEGMTSLDFSLGGAPAILCVPASLTSLNLSGNASDPSAVTVYAYEGTESWNVAKAALEAIGADPDTQLKPYTAFAASYSISGISGNTVTLQAASTGGVGGVWYRFVQQNADGTSEVLQDWSATSTFTWNSPGTAGTTLSVEARDTCELTCATTFVPESTDAAAPIIATDVPETLAAEVGDTATLTVAATSSDGGKLTYQWYCDGEAVTGATSATCAVDTTTAGTHRYYVTITNTIEGGASASVNSAVCTVTITEAGEAVDASALETYVQQVADLDEDAYTADTWSAFKSALDAANAVLANDEATQEQVNEALSNLQAAYEGLKLASADHTSLPDGTYDVTVSMLSALNTSGESMASALLNPSATLVVADGSSTLFFKLDQGAKVMGYDAYMSDVKYYPDGMTVDESTFAASGKGSPSAATVIASDASGYPTELSIPLNSQAAEEGLTLMYGTFAEMGSQYWVLAIDWDAFDEQYGSEDPEPETANKDALLAALNSVPSSQGDAADVDWALLQSAVAAAQAVYDDAEAEQAEVDAAVKELSSALDVFNGIPGYSFQEGGTYQLPISWVDAQGKQVVNDLFAATAQVRALVGGGFEVTLSPASADADARISNVRYGEAGLAAEASQDAGLQTRSVDTTSYTFPVDSLTKAVKVAYDFLYAGSTATQSGYVVFDTTLVRQVEEPTPDPEPEPSTVDKSSLDDAISKAAALTQGNKTASAFATLQKAIAAAQAVAADAKATQDEVDAAVSTLEQAIAAFNGSADAADGKTDDTSDDAADDKTDDKTDADGKTDDKTDDKTDADGTVDTSGLAEKVEQASALTQGKKSDAAWTALQNAITQARAVLADDAATADELAAAVSLLEEAIAAFNASVDVVDDADNGSGDDNANGTGSGNGSNNGNVADPGADSTGGNTATGDGAQKAADGKAALAKTADALPLAGVAGLGVLALAALATAALATRRL